MDAVSSFEYEEQLDYGEDEDQLQEDMDAGMVEGNAAEGNPEEVLEQPGEPRTQALRVAA